jgi:hypothetical protein
MTEDERARESAGKLEDVDLWLRRGLTPERESVERIVRRSLRAGTGARYRPSSVVLAVASAAILLAVAAVILLPRGGLREAGPVDGKGTVRILTITNASGEIEVFYPPQHFDELTIINSDGIVAAIAPAANRHFMFGGDDETTGR